MIAPLYSRTRSASRALCCTHSAAMRSHAARRMLRGASHACFACNSQGPAQSEVPRHEFAARRYAPWSTAGLLLRHVGWLCGAPRVCSSCGTSASSAERRGSASAARRLALRSTAGLLTCDTSTGSAERHGSALHCKGRNRPRAQPRARNARRRGIIAARRMLMCIACSRRL